MAANDNYKVITLPESVERSRGLVSDEGSIDVRIMAKLLGTIITETLTGDLPASRANTAIRGARTMIALADACRRSSDSPRPLLQITHPKLLEDRTDDTSDEPPM